MLTIKTTVRKNPYRAEIHLINGLIEIRIYDKVNPLPIAKETVTEIRDKEALRYKIKRMIIKTLNT